MVEFHIFGLQFSPMTLSTRYNPAEVEDKWYAHWLEKNYFHSTPDEREPFTIVIPPPNVTGVLHMGHMLNNTIQDVLIRKARLEGKNACWVPGTDHASIATEAKVVQMLRERGIKKSDLSRDEFMEYAWEWKEKYGGIILEQLRKLGASCDWERTRFTMEEKLSDAVIQVFVDLYNKKKIYRGLRMINWDPEAQTVLSNEEVIYGEENSRLFHLSYQIEGTDEFVTIATTRPETILGDSAIAVHPKDERYAHLKGKRALVPLINRSIPIIFDDYVDREFGTGALKVTPAHDVNDYEIGKRHNLETIEIFHPNATMNEAAQLFIGMDRFEVRKQIVPELKAAGNLVDIEDYRNNVGRSERTKAVIEPRLSLQWYVDMKSLAGPALENVMNDEVTFHPANQKNTYAHWLENIRDWCVSRQLWWGQRVPAYFVGDEVFVATTAEKALAQAREKLNDPGLTLADLKQDEDVLDTWFSSWLWPISVFDGFETKEELDYYYPTNVLVTGADIIYLWVARMIMAGYEWQGERPFNDVYFTGMVRDPQRRKMSKSLGNSPDALEMMKEYGADAVRFGVLSCSPAGGDLLFDIKLVEQGRNFCNKIWNALRLIKGWEIDSAGSATNTDLLIHRWMEEKFNQIVSELEHSFETYRLSEALVSLYSFIWNDYCSWYLETIKPPHGGKISSDVLEHAVSLLERLMVTLHPYMPFITEEIWHQLRDRQDGDDCVVSAFAGSAAFDAGFIAQIESAKELVTKVRDLRNKHGVSMKEPIKLFAVESTSAKALVELSGWTSLVGKLANLESFELVSGDAAGIGFLSGTEKYFLDMDLEINVEEEREKIQSEIKRTKGFLMGIEKKLSNERFVANAPEAVVAKERKKLEDGRKKIQILEENLASL